MRAPAEGPIFLKRFGFRMLLQYGGMVTLLTDIYQDLTFPVIAVKSYFDLWQVSAYHAAVGYGLLQFVANLGVVCWCYYKYRKSRTPAERERHKIEGTFILLRTSDDLILLYTVM